MVAALVPPDATVGVANGGDASGYHGMLWQPTITRVLTPADVSRAAKALGVQLPQRPVDKNGNPKGPMDYEAVISGEYYLLPLVVELLAAPLPGEWREVVVDGQWRYREGATVHRL
jgi:hypothetical protein